MNSRTAPSSSTTRIRLVGRLPFRPPTTARRWHWPPGERRFRGNPIKERLSLGARALRPWLARDEGDLEPLEAGGRVADRGLECQRLARRQRRPVETEIPLQQRLAIVGGEDGAQHRQGLRLLAVIDDVALDDEVARDRPRVDESLDPQTGP